MKKKEKSQITQFLDRYISDIYNEYLIFDKVNQFFFFILIT